MAQSVQEVGQQAEAGWSTGGALTSSVGARWGQGVQGGPGVGGTRGRGAVLSDYRTGGPVTHSTGTAAVYCFSQWGHGGMAKSRRSGDTVVT